MTWLSILGIAVVVVAIVSVFGLNPGRPVSRTRLMTVARVVLILFGLVLLYLGFKR